MKTLAILLVVAAGFSTQAFATVPSTAEISTSQPYALQQGDELALSVQNHDDMRTQVTVLPDGTITVPTLGRVQAAGLTIDQLTANIVAALSPNFNEPQVSIVVQSSTPRKVNVVGAVKSPGIYDYKPGWKVLDLLAACGGPAQDVNLTEATLWTNGGKTSTNIDVVQLMAASAGENQTISAGDCLIVKALDPEKGQVAIVGEVDHPGFFNASQGGSSVLGLLTQAGGGTSKAALSRVQLMHDGHVQVVNVREMMASIDTAATAPLAMPGDTINVPQNKERVAILGQVHSPGAYDIPDGETLTVTGAITLAGGLTTDADSGKASIVHQATAGSPKPMMVDLDPEKASAALPNLQPGDVVYVPTRKHGKSGLDVIQALTPLGLISTLLR